MSDLQLQQYLFDVQGYLVIENVLTCGTCPGCVAEDRQKCPMCLDKPKYGGRGKKKQCCVK